MNHLEIQMKIKHDVSALDARHKTAAADLREHQRHERDELNKTQSEERSQLNNFHMALWQEYRSSEDSASRVMQHNEKVRASTLSIKLRTQFGFEGITNDELVEEVIERLDKLSLEYKNYGADPVEHKRLEKRERDFRAAIITLGGSLEGVKRISWRYEQQLNLNSPEPMENTLTEKTDAEMDALLNQTPRGITPEPEAVIAIKIHEALQGDPEGFGGDEYADPKYHGSNVREQDALDRRLHDEWGTDGGRHH
jgi:hypothetical protein